MQLHNRIYRLTTTNVYLKQAYKHSYRCPLLSDTLPSPQSAHGWLSTVLCVIISRSSSSQLSSGFSAIRLKAKEENVEKLEGFTSKMPWERLMLLRLFTDKSTADTPRLQACVRYQNMLIVLIHCTSRWKRSPFSQQYPRWWLAACFEQA